MRPLLREFHFFLSVSTLIALPSVDAGRSGSADRNIHSNNIRSNDGQRAETARERKSRCGYLSPSVDGRISCSRVNAGSHARIPSMIVPANIRCMLSGTRDTLRTVPARYSGFLSFESISAATSSVGRFDDDGMACLHSIRGFLYRPCRIPPLSGHRGIQRDKLSRI